MSHETPPPPPGGYGTPGGGPAEYPGAGATEPPNDFLVPAILSFFCCWPFAIPAILSAAKVNAQWNLGDYAGAQERASKAKKFTITAVIIGVIWWIVSFILYFAFIAAAMSTMPTTVN